MMKRVQIYIEPETKDAIDYVAFSERRTMSSVARQALEEYLERREQGEEEEDNDEEA